MPPGEAKMDVIVEAATDYGDAVDRVRPQSQWYACEIIISSSSPRALLPRWTRVERVIGMMFQS